MTHFDLYVTMRQRPAGVLPEVDLGDRQHGVAEDADVHLAAVDVALDDHFVPQLEHRLDALGQLARVPHDRPLLDAE